MSDQPLSSPAYDVADAFAANELFQERGWTDGLPVVPGHPIANDRDEDLRAKAEAAVLRLVALLIWRPRA
jgi:hypothetical protein